MHRSTTRWRGRTRCTTRKHPCRSIQSGSPTSRRQSWRSATIHKTNDSSVRYFAGNTSGAKDSPSPLPDPTSLRSPPPPFAMCRTTSSTGKRLDRPRARRRLLRAARSHRPVGFETAGHLMPVGTHGASRNRGTPARHDHGRSGVQRGLLHRCGSAGGCASRRRTRRVAGGGWQWPRWPAKVKCGRTPLSSTDKSRRIDCTGAGHGAIDRFHGGRLSTHPAGVGPRPHPSRVSAIARRPSHHQCRERAIAWGRVEYRQTGVEPHRTGTRQHCRVDTWPRRSGPWAWAELYGRALTIARRHHRGHQKRAGRTGSGPAAGPSAAAVGTADPDATR